MSTNINTGLALIGILLSFALFLDNIDTMLNDKLSKVYKIVRTLSIWIIIIILLHFYFIL